MEISQVFESPQFSTVSPNGAYIASLTQQNLYVQHASSLAPAYTYPLDTPSPSKIAYESHTIQWSASSTYLILLCGQGIHVFSLSDPSLIIHISNGTGSLGKIQAAEILGDHGREQVLVVWEFGRVNAWDLTSGRATEIGDLKMTDRGKSWAVRRVSRQPEVLVLLMRQGAQDVLSFYMPPSVTPFRLVTLPTVDALSLSWSRCGGWLSVLDSALNAQQVHIYTAEGFPFRQYPPKAQLTPPSSPAAARLYEQLGYRTLIWSRDRLLLADAQSITFLHPKSFSSKGKLDMSKLNCENVSLEDAVIAYQETIDAARQRSYTLLTGQKIPAPSSKICLSDLQANVTGSHASCHDEAMANALYILNIRTQRVQSILLQHAAIRRTIWHPSRPSMLLVLGEEGSVHLLDVDSEQPPIYVHHELRSKPGTGRLDARWIAQNMADSHRDSAPPNPQKLAILITSRKGGYQILWPEGRPESAVDLQTTDEGDVSEDSLYDILSGRTPLPELNVRKVEAEVEAEPTERLDDTFREKVQAKTMAGIEDDSEIF